VNFAAPPPSSPLPGPAHGPRPLPPFPASLRSAPAAAFNCSVCYNAAARERFWGFATVLVAVHTISAASSNGANARLQRLAGLGYRYFLYAPLINGSDYVVASSARPPRDPVTLAVPVPLRDPALAWRLEMAPGDGWWPNWRGPMVAVVAVASTLFGALTAAVLASRRRLMRLVSRLQVQRGRRGGEGGGAPQERGEGLPTIDDRDLPGRRQRRASQAPGPPRHLAVPEPPCPSCPRPPLENQHRACTGEGADGRPPGPAAKPHRLRARPAHRRARARRRARGVAAAVGGG
jgi:hypothetical protein